jgi:predicted DNA-binding mobile mystery protein A
MKEATRNAFKARRSLDSRLNSVRPIRPALTRPNHGWIRAIRQALGMTATQLGQRLGVTQSTISGFEAKEVAGAIQLNTLRRLAEAMDCTLVYAFVPNVPLDETVRKRAREVVSDQLKPVEHTMLLENQTLTKEEREEFLNHYIRNELDLSVLWR